MLRSLVSALVITLSILLTPAWPQQSGTAGDVQSADIAIRQEFSELGELIGQMSKHFGASRKFCAPDPGNILAARLAVFRRRFGVDPRTTPEWHDLRDAADRALAGAGDRGHAECGEVQDVSSQMDRYVLLDILGQSLEAGQILSGVSTTGADGCIWCTAENSVVVNQRRSEEAERRGDVRGALRYLHDSALDIGFISEPKAGGLAGEDLLLARYGLLLEEAGHADTGLLVLQDLVRTRPDSIGGQLARAEVERRDALGGVDKARFMSLVIKGVSECQSCAIASVWSTDDPTSLRWIAARLPQRNEDECTRTAAFDPAAFEDARPALEAVIESGALNGLFLINVLPGGAEPHVESYLEAVKKLRLRESAPFTAMDEGLRWLHGDGPQHVIPIGSLDWNGLAEDWQAWRAQTGTRVRSAR